MFRELPAIMKETGVKEDTLKNWVYGYHKDDDRAWYHERASQMSRFVRELVQKNGQAADDVIRVGFSMVLKSLNEREDLTNEYGDKIPITTKEAKDITVIMTSIANLMALSNEDPEEEQEPDDDSPEAKSKTFTIADLRAAIMLDPFINNIIVTKKEPVHVTHTITDEQLEGPLAAGDLAKDATGDRDEQGTETE